MKYNLLFLSSLYPTKQKFDMKIYQCSIIATMGPEKFHLFGCALRNTSVSNYGGENKTDSQAEPYWNFISVQKGICVKDETPTLLNTFID
jgi:hypothetical protein